MARATPRAQFVQRLADLALQARGTSTKNTHPAFARSLLDFGSETPDNLECARRIDLGTFRIPATGHRALGLLTRESRTPLSELAWHTEGTEIPRDIRARFPELTIEEWEAFQRLVTLIFKALEQECSEEPPKGDASEG